jgi:xylan 1,4-beta-xylosidase
MGKTELQDADSASWACKDADGDMQVLCWDFTYTLPDSVNNQAYYIKNLPSKPKGKVNVQLSGVPAGKYQMEVYRIGYEINDPYTTYYQLGRTNQLTRQEVSFIKKKNSGAPVAEDLIQVDATGKFSKKFPLRENDVYLVKLVKL